ncbi:MAG TPA: ATPase, partial [Kofleriaceae bacterium]|nr:ATPase [Kofleriaceae bacterium]
MASHPPTQAPPLDITRLATQFQQIARVLNTQFLDKQEIIRLLMISAIAGEHMVIVGPPGTA